MGMPLRVNGLDHAVALSSVRDLSILAHLLQESDWIHIGVASQDVRDLGRDSSFVDRKDLDSTHEVVPGLELLDKRQDGEAEALDLA